MFRGGLRPTAVPPWTIMRSGNVGPRVSPYHVSLGMAGRQVSGAAQARITGAYLAPADG